MSTKERSRTCAGTTDASRLSSKLPAGVQQRLVSTSSTTRVAVITNDLVQRQDMRVDNGKGADGNARKCK